MNRQLKHILARLARLSRRDQRWVLKRLSSRQLEIFEQWNGSKLLNDAQRFRGLKNDCIPIPAEPLKTMRLPMYCEELSMRSPLFSAIILHHGRYSWRSLFLKEYDREGLIQAAIDNQVFNIKPMVQNLIVDEWAASMSFESHLDDAHG